MSESKFTPGPWYISVDNRNCPSVRAKGGYVAFAPSIIDYGDPLRYIDEATEVQANARLIAAAPDMYEALQVAKAKPAKMLEMFERNGFVFDNLEDRWQKLAFTLYTEIVQAATDAENVLERAESGDE